MYLYKSLLSCKYSVLRTAAKSPRKPMLFVTLFSGGKLIFTFSSKTDKSWQLLEVCKSIISQTLLYF